MLEALGGAGVAALAAGCQGRRAAPGADSPDGTVTAPDDTEQGSLPAPEPAYARWTYRTPHDALASLTLAPTDPPTPALYVAGGRSGAAGDSALTALGLEDGSETWQVPLPDTPRTTPLHGGDDRPRVYITTGPQGSQGQDTALHAVDPVRGRRIWGFDTDDRRALAPLGTTDDAVFLGRHDDQRGAEGEYLYGLEAADGTRRWRVPGGDATAGDGTVRRGTLLVVTRAGLRAIEPASGDNRWSVSSASIEGPAVGNNGERVFLAHDGVVRALGLTDGGERWRREAGFTVSAVTRPRSAASTTVYVGDYDGRLLAVSPLDGGERWTLEVDREGFVPTVQRTSERLFVGGAGVHALDPVSGERQWSFGEGSAKRLAVHASTTVFALDMQADSLHALDPATGDQRWTFAPDAALTGLAAAGDTAFVGVEGTVYALDGAATG